ncbi:hypothetical protein AAVH_27440 [Aphelenchoides avenae]|nr:hypothetical protein AAVH_27440 [Aphelenchus avenae]
MGNGDGPGGEGKRRLIASTTFGIAALSCFSSVLLQARTVVVYRRMSRLLKRDLKEEFALLGYALLGLAMPIGLSCIFGVMLFKPRYTEHATTAFPYLIDYMSLCEPVWLLLSSRTLREDYLRMFGCNKLSGRDGKVVFFKPDSDRKTSCSENLSRVLVKF